MKSKLGKDKIDAGKRLTREEREFCELNQREATRENVNELDGNVARIMWIPNPDSILFAAMVKSEKFKSLMK